MNIHIIKSGVVQNTISAESIEHARALFPDCDCVEYEGAEKGWTYSGGVFSPPVVASVVPESVTPRQIRQALTQAGLRAVIEESIAGGDQNAKDWYEYSTAFERHHPIVLGMAQALGVTDQQLDDLWVLAASL